MARVALLTHLGLGDMLLCRGMVWALCQQCEKVVLICARKYMASIQTLFEDLTANLALAPVEEAHDITPAKLQHLLDAGYQILLAGYHADVTGSWMTLDPWWSRAMYKQVGMDPGLITRGFRVPEGRREQSRALLARAREICDGEDMVVVHDDEQRALTLPPLPDGCVMVHVNDPRIRSDNIFDYLDLLRAARHFHTIDSCFSHLVDLCGLDTPMTVHAYARNADMTPVYERRGDVRIVRSALELA